MERLKRYPRGYLTRVASASLQVDGTQVEVNPVDCDTVIEDLYKLYAGRGVNRDSWEFRKLVIQRCAQLYGDFYRWLILNLAGNDNIYDYNLAFLEDTVKFLRTGHRSASVNTWYEVVTENPEPQHGVAGIQRVKNLGLAEPQEFAGYIGLWCSHPGGFDDMLCTTQLLFGATKGSKKSQPLF